MRNHNEYRIRYGRIKEYGNGVRRCALCEQRLINGQEECPNCGARLTGIDFIDHDEPTRPDPYVRRRATSESRQTYGGDVKKDGRYGRRLIVLAVLSILVLSFSGILPSGRTAAGGRLRAGTNNSNNDNRNISAVVNDSKMDKTVWFGICCENSEDYRKAIAAFMKDSGYEHGDFHYTADGYVVCSITNIDENDIEEVPDKFNAWLKKNGRNYKIKVEKFAVFSR
jgi:hypothetical protein